MAWFLVIMVIGQWVRRLPMEPKIWGDPMSSLTLSPSQRPFSGKDSVYEKQEIEEKSKQTIVGVLSMSIGRRRYFNVYPRGIPFPEDFFTCYGLDVGFRIYKSNYLKIGYDYGPAKYWASTSGDYYDLVVIDSILYNTEHILSFDIGHKFSIYRRFLYLVYGIGIQIIHVEDNIYCGEHKVTHKTTIGGIPWMAEVELYFIRSGPPLFLSFEVKHSPAIWGVIALFGGDRGDSGEYEAVLHTLDFSLGLGYQFKR